MITVKDSYPYLTSHLKIISMFLLLYEKINKKVF